MKKTSIGIIGVGRQGLRLAEHVRKDVKDAKLIAVCRRSQKGHEYSKEHGLKFYANHHDLLADDEISVVIITSPSGLHGVQAIDSLKAGKHLLIDKPIASSVAEGNRIITLAKKKTLVVAINFPLRVNPLTITLKENLPTIGRLRKIQVVASHGPPRGEWQSNTELSNGGVIMDIGSHYFDLLSFLTASPPKAVNYAYSDELENEHSGFIDLQYNDFSASIVLLRQQKLKKNIITCAGDKGFLFADYALREVIVSNHHQVNEIRCQESNDFESILNNLVRTVNNQEDAIANAEDGLTSLRTVLAVYKSIETGDSVRL